MLRLSARRAVPGFPGRAALCRSPPPRSPAVPSPIAGWGGHRCGEVGWFEVVYEFWVVGAVRSPGQSRELGELLGTATGRVRSCPGRLRGDLGNTCSGPVFGWRGSPFSSCPDAQHPEGQQGPWERRRPSCGHKPLFPPGGRASWPFPRGCEGAGRDGPAGSWAAEEPVGPGVWGDVCSCSFSPPGAPEGSRAGTPALTGGRRGVGRWRRTASHCPSLVPQCPHVQASVIKMPRTFALCSMHSVCDFFPSHGL